MKKLTRQEAVAAVGERSVIAIGDMNVEFTNRVTNDGTVEFSAGISAFDHQAGEAVTLKAFYYQTAEDVAANESLDDLDWGAPDHYTIV